MHATTLAASHEKPYPTWYESEHRLYFQAASVIALFRQHHDHALFIAWLVKLTHQRMILGIGRVQREAVNQVTFQAFPA